MIDEVLHARFASPLNYQMTNYDLIRTHVGAHMIDRPHTLHRRTDCGYVPHVADDNCLCTQSFNHRDMLLAMDERRNALEICERPDESPACFAASTRDKDHNSEYNPL